tara:strand:+ start:113 stop:640 length:528 start_codon:yes stop_codon:yes gene_type:complete
MASLTFGLGDKFLDYDIEDLKQFDDDLNSLYKNYQERNPEFFSTFRPVILSPSKDEIIFNENFFKNGEIDLPESDENYVKWKYFLPFIIQGGNKESTKEVNWGSSDEELAFNKDISNFTNDLLKILNGCITFNFAFSGSYFYENYEVIIEMDEENDYPYVSFDSEYFEDEGDEDW